MENEKVIKNNFYPLADYHFMQFNNIKPEGYFIRARAKGEKRNPLKGEWYLSGAIIEAYQAKSDMTTPFHIAEIVLIKRITTEHVIEILPNTY